MRWETQSLEIEADGALPGLQRIPGLVRSVTTPDFAGVTFHEVLARSVLNEVPASSDVPFRWTVNPYRGCTHSCRYCFARRTHEWLDFDAGRDFDSEIVVKVNAPELLAREVARKSWSRDHVALGTNTDPYQRAEGRYKLMPGIIRALAGSGTPFSILTKGPLLKRDLPLLVDASATVEVGLAVSIAILDDQLHQSVEPGIPSPRARMSLVRAIREAGFHCSVLLAPVLPWLTDSAEQLDEIVSRLAAAGASRVTMIPLHLRPGARQWFMRWLQDEHPALVPRYQQLYGRGAYVPAGYKEELSARLRPILQRHDLDRRRTVTAAAGFRGTRPARVDEQLSATPVAGQLRLY
ncbi:Rv2578c family radical SAM protein [Phytoactinopolyspora mesophila]|uniref:Radical SAM protein n=1 Tax=Phytoactinopolyspora mesophila TaxID=2650750 RepID=A0A7K3MC98_9ACTN|nr:Rv2578c family radical SAM protein [Phytoactinopolyspora mesophila]NDL60800.1 radical SAM protein [Phytoactinopolyspora mesophila]